MPLKAMVPSLEGIAADLHKEYKQITEGPHAGKFILDVIPEAGFAVEDVTGLKKTVQTLRNEKDSLAALIKKFEGLDAEAARTALEKVKEWGDMTPEQKAQELLKNKEAQLAAKFKQQEDTLKNERDGAIKQLDQNIRIAALTGAIAGKKGNADLLLPHVLSQTRMKRLDTGQFAVEVVDGEGNPRISPSGSGTDMMTIPQLIDEMAGKFPSAFEGSGVSGSGAAGGGSGSGTPKSNGGPVKTVSRSDQQGMNQNLEDIAKGKVKVV